MNQLLEYWPLLAGGGLVSFLKIGDKPIWKRIKDTIVKPKTTDTDTKEIEEKQGSILALLPMILPLIELIAKKPPVTVVDKPPTVVSDPSKFDITKIIEWVTKIAVTPGQPEQPNVVTVPSPTVIDTVTTLSHESTVAHLMACAAAVAKANPDSDVLITIDSKGTAIKVTPRAEPK